MTRPQRLAYNDPTWLDTVAAWLLARVLDALTLGEDTARSLCLPLAPLRALLIAEQQATEQTIDTVSLDVVREAGFSPAATASARETVESFQQFIEAHIDEITALQIIYSQRRVTDEQVAELAERLRGSATLPKAYIYCALEDTNNYAMNQRLYHTLQTNGFDAHFADGHGQHDWAYWDRCIGDFLNAYFADQ